MTTSYKRNNYRNLQVPNDVWMDIYQKRLAMENRIFEKTRRKVRVTYGPMLKLFLGQKPYFTDDTLISTFDKRRKTGRPKSNQLM